MATTRTPAAARRRAAAANLPDWAAQLLTMDCVIHGYLPERPPSGGWYGVLSYLAPAAASGGNNHAAGDVLELASAQVCAAHAAAKPAPAPSVPAMLAITRAPRIQVALAGILALLPSDPTGARLAHATLDKFTNPAASVLYVGPYLLRGRLWQPAKRRRPGPWALLSDAEIECLRPGVDLAGLKGPLVAVRRAAIQAQHAA
ncbi:MAG: hypothetical protein IT318_12760 [Anaerolineales bacterium]|nr:hypothetical protein [Anaerolineales bacterium]